jgi:hypothetical protein
VNQSGSGDEPDQQVVRLEDERAGAVLPHALEAELEPSIVAEGETVLCDRRSGDVLAEPLDLSAVVAVDALLCVHVDATNFGDRLILGVVVTRLMR